MIDFRYHVVSLVAVLLALATGILVGSSLLNQSLIDSQRETIASLASTRGDLREELGMTQGQIDYRDTYLASIADDLVQDRLLGTSVVLVALPEADGGQVDQLGETLADAGARVTGTVTVSADLFLDDGKEGSADEGSRERVRQRTEVLRRNGMPGARDASPAAQLAAALVTDDQDRGSTRSGDDPATVTDPDSATGSDGTTDPAATDPGSATGSDGPTDPAATDSGDAQGRQENRRERAAAELLGALDEAGFIDRSGPVSRAELALLVTGAPPEAATEATDRTREGAVALARELDDAGRGAVLAGPLEAADDGAVAALRGSGAASKVSTVDTVNTPFGRVATTYALVEQLAGGSGAYGSAASADRPLPQFRRS